MTKAVALLSGGLDSTLAVLVLLKQGIDVTAITYLTHFGCDVSDSSSCSGDPYPAAEQYGFQVKLSHLSDKFINIVKSPKFGHGKNMNPCIDCRILMLKEAKTYMELQGADFLVTGEVLGQRPMSQRKDTFPVIDREAGVKGLVLRPLSAKLLKPTLAETKGLVDRDRLYGFNGRSRKPQIALAEEFGLKEYPPPAGGCLLTEPNYSYRLKELISHNPDFSLRDISLLRAGRHFRLSEGCKAIVGRDEADNGRIESLLTDRDITMIVEDVGSPVTLLTGDVRESDIRTAASLTARYSGAKHLPEVEVSVFNNVSDFLYKIKTPPASDYLLDSLHVIEKKAAGVKVSN